MNQIDFLKCYFTNNMNYQGHIARYVMMACKDYYSYNGVTIYISDSEISENKDFGFLFTNCHDHFLVQPIKFDVIINNTKFALIELSESDNPFFNLRGVSLQLEGPILFTEFEVDSIIIFGIETHVYVNSYIEFSNINTMSIIETKTICLSKNTLVNITSNHALLSIFKREGESCNLLYPLCLLQYAEIADDSKEISALSKSIIFQSY